MLKLMMLLVLLTPSALASVESQVLKLLVNDRAQDALSRGEGKDYQQLKQALKALGYQLEIFYAPNIRGYTMANTGQIDGVLAAPAFITQKFPNLTALDSPLITVNIYLYGRSDQEESNWQRRNINSIAVPRSSSLFDTPLKDVLPHGDRFLFDGPAQGIHLLAAGRVDALVMSEEHVSSSIQAEPHLQNKITKLVPAISKLKMYPALHRRHSALIRKLNQLIAENALGDHEL